MDKEILNMEEAAELFNVSVKTFIKLLKEEKVPARKIGREWRFSRKALVDWLSSGDSQAYSSSESETKEFFNRVAPQWEDIRRGYYDESVINRLLEMDFLKPGMTVLDLGAGDGYLSRTVARHVRKVVAVDISGEMLKELRKKAENEGISNIETVESDGCDMPLEKASVDVVCSNMYLHHIEEPENAIIEMKRVLKPKGILFLADFKEHSNTELKEKMHDVWQGFSQEDIKAWFEKCGFSSIKINSTANRKGLKGKGEENIFIMTAVG
jgi:excisionase family DNA binding protein